MSGLQSGTLVIFWLILLAILTLVALLLYFLFTDLLRKKTWAPRILNSVFLEVSLPKDSATPEQEPQKEEKDMIAIAEQFFTTIATTAGSGLAHMFGINDYISFEIAAVGKKISFYVNVSKKLHSLLEKQLHAQYPRAQIDVIKPYNIFGKKSFVSAAELRLQKKFAYPIRTYKSMETDPINALTNSLSKLEPDEGAAIQLIISPAGLHWQGKPRKYALEIQQGRNPEVVTSSPAQRFLFSLFKGVGDVFDQFVFSSSNKNPQHQANRYDASGLNKPIQLTPMQQELIKKFEEKASRPGYRVNLRMVTSSRDQATADLHLKNILSSFMQYSMPPFNGFHIVYKKASKIVTDYIFRIFRNTRVILNTEEIASLWHPPTRFTETPNIKWLMAKKAAPPPNAPSEGLLLGKNVFRSITTQIFSERDDRRRHMYIIGRTGTGKTELMKNMVIQDIKKGEGLCVVDPHGDLVEDVLQHIPKERADDVILFEPFDMERPLGLNMLEVTNVEEKDFAIQEMIAIFYKLFPPEMIGPMFEHNMRNVMLTLMEDKQYPGTIADIPRMFTDPEFQRYKLSKVRDPIVRSFWEKEMAKTSDFHKSEMLGYLISKVGRFVENEMMRNIIGQPQSSFDFRKVMDEGKVLLINLSKGKTGEINAKLLGLIIVSKLQMAALARADTPEDQRRDFYLYVDEFQNFVTESFATILSEARKYRLNLIMAHQFISQLSVEKTGSSALDTRMRDAVFGNAGTMICFRIGVEDAEIMAKEFAPVFNEFDLVNIDRFQAYVKLMIKGAASRPFNMETYPKPPGANLELAQVIKNLSRLKFGRPRTEVEREILTRTKLGTPTAAGPVVTERTR
ncbi:MAG: type IV secretion system DNA-binding domain-containing protein [Candidatus Doudnabacteria bacterium]|nr:type IV secretion system DNA-binding domain-containing protein [Candidatus Doudnabacteria bacterium]